MNLPDSPAPSPGGSLHAAVRRMGAARRRFRELAVKEAMGTITPDERGKLNRYQALLRYRPSAGERKMLAEIEWRLERTLKMAGRLLHEATNSPNDKMSH